MVPLIAAAIIGGGLRAGVGALQNRSETRRKRNLINDAYGDSSQRLTVDQSNVRQSTDESLNARGLLPAGGGQRAVVAGTYGALGSNGTQQGPAAHSIGAAMQARTEQQLGFERKSLDFAHDKANADNDADSFQNSINAIGAGVNTAASIYGAGSEMGAARAPAASTTPMGTQIGTIHGAFGVDPLTGDGVPSVHRNVNGNGQPNSSFNVFG